MTNIENLCKILSENNDVGKNTAATEMQTSLACIKLRKAKIPPLPDEFCLLLQNFNGLSHEGNTVFGVDTKTDFFPDAAEVNLSILEGQKTDCVILGQDEYCFLVYDYFAKKYRVIDKEDFSDELCTDDISDAVCHILGI